jgi:hypothetical protein
MLRHIAPATSFLNTNPSSFSSSSTSMNQAWAQQCQLISAPRQHLKTKDIALPRPPTRPSDESHEFSAQVRRRRRLIGWRKRSARKQRDIAGSSSALAQSEKATQSVSGRRYLLSLVASQMHQGPSLLSHQQAVPNPSLKRSANGVPPGPRGRAVYHRPRGPAVTPPSPA